MTDPIPKPTALDMERDLAGTYTLAMVLCGDDVRGIIRRCAAAEAEVWRSRDEAEEHAADVLPEDVGCVEYIKTLRRRLDESEARAEQMREALKTIIAAEGNRTGHYPLVADVSDEAWIRVREALSSSAGSDFRARVRAEALEEAANLAQNLVDEHYLPFESRAGTKIARAIRSLASRQGDEGRGKEGK